MDDDEAPSVYDYDWNDHYVAAQIEKNVWFTIDLNIDAKLFTINNHSIEVNEDKNKTPLRKTKRMVF